MALNSLHVKIIESSHVGPPPGTTPCHASLPFTFFDVCWMIIPPVERLFFYPYCYPTAHFMSSFLPSLKQSLSLALKTYYPLTGSFRRSPGMDDKLEHYYVKGDAVSFTVAECDSQFEDLASDHERDISVLDYLIPRLSKSKDELQPLLAVQVTVFPEHGIVIGTTVHHTACDGTTSMKFMHVWAQACLSGASVSLRDPIFDRSLISDPSNLYSFFYNQVQRMLKSGPEGGVPASHPPPNLILATFTIGKKHILRLKQVVSAKAEERNNSFHCSTIVVVYAYVWTCYVRAKGIDSSWRAGMGIPAELRVRLQPPIPTEYFGNCVALCLASADVSDLIQDDGIVVAAEAVGKAIEHSCNRLKAARNWAREYTAVAGVPVLTIAGSPKFKVYDIDFGLGRPVKVEIVSATRTGSMSVAESRDEPGGIEIGIAFPKDEMECFKKHFFDGLKLYTV